MTGLGWISFDSFFFSLLSFSFYIYFWESKAYRASDGLSSVEIRLGNGVIVSCVVILLTLHASQVIYICWLFFFGCSYTIPNYFCWLAAPYHFHIQCKGLHFRGWLLVFQFISHSSVWAVFGVLFVDFLFISLYDWTEHRSIEMKSDIAWSCKRMEALGFIVHAQPWKYRTLMALCGPFRSHSFSSHGFIRAARYQPKLFTGPIRINQTIPSPRKWMYADRGSRLPRIALIRI